MDSPVKLYWVILSQDVPNGNNFERLRQRASAHGRARLTEICFEFHRPLLVKLI
jgi:hypothetical protein